MADVDEWLYVSKYYSKERLQKWIEGNEPWRISESVEETKVLEADKQEEKKILTSDEVWDLTKSQQTELLKSYGVEDIPKYEKDRVKLILDLQNDN